MNDKPIHEVLQAAITDLSTGTLYELARGLMLSTCDREALLKALYDELDKRAEAARAKLSPDSEGGAK